jgi:hypothetical protein
MAGREFDGRESDRCGAPRPQRLDSNPVTPAQNRLPNEAGGRYTTIHTGRRRPLHLENVG